MPKISNVAPSPRKPPQDDRHTLIWSAAGTGFIESRLSLVTPRARSALDLVAGLAFVRQCARSLVCLVGPSFNERQRPDRWMKDFGCALTMIVGVSRLSRVGEEVPAAP